MATIAYKDIANDFHLLPLRFLSIYVPTGSPDGDPDLYLNIYYLETESSFSLIPVIKSTSKGSDRILGYNGTMTIYVSFNKYDASNLLTQINSIAGLEKSIELGMGTMSAPDDAVITEPPAINSTAEMELRVSTIPAHTTFLIEDVEIAAEIEYVAFRPRMIIRINFFRTSIAALFDS